MGHLSLRGVCQIVEARDRSEGHGTVVLASVVGGSVHDVLAIVGSGGEILQIDPSSQTLVHHIH